MARSGTLPPEPLSEVLGDSPWADEALGNRPLPAADCLLVGAALLSGLRPFARDLSASLAPPGSDDEALEAAAERLLQTDPALVEERLAVEEKCGFSLHPDGYVEVDGSRVPRPGVAKQLRLAWVGARVPKKTVALAHWHDLGAWRCDASMVLIHLPGAPKSLAGTWRCADTGAQVTLAGGSANLPIDRRDPAARAAFAAVDDLAHSGATLALSGSRQTLYQFWIEQFLSKR
jgi:hypothetical protein